MSELNIEGIVIDSGHGGICLTRPKGRMAIKLINIKKLRYFDRKVSFLMV